MSQREKPGSSRETIRILLVDDEAGDATLTRAMLDRIPGPRMEMDWAATFADGLAALEAESYDVFLVDYFLDEGTGLDLLREARSRQLRTPMIMFTGKGSRSVDVEAMKAGAADYLVKGRIDPDALERSIRYALDRARAERELRESEERHRGMFDHLPIGLYRCTPDGGFVDANPALVRTLGFPEPGLLRERYARTLYVGAEDSHRFRRILDEEGVVRGFESWVTRTDGVQLRLRNTARLHRTPDGALQYVEGAVEDVTPSPQELRRRGHAARYRALSAGLPVALVAVDREGRIMDASPGFQELSGHRATDLLMRDLVELVHADDRQELSAVLGAALRVEEASEEGDGDAAPPSAVHRCRLATVDEGHAPVELVAAPVVDEDGEADHLLVLVRRSPASP